MGMFPKEPRTLSTTQGFDQTVANTVLTLFFIAGVYMLQASRNFAPNSYNQIVYRNVGIFLMVSGLIMMGLPYAERFLEGVAKSIPSAPRTLPGNNI